jgi:hypothetical protein
MDRGSGESESRRVLCGSEALPLHSVQMRSVAELEYLAIV